jgi:segregation and condensation protein B
MRTLLERGWVKVVGQREVPGRPSLYGTTRAFLDYFDLKSLGQLPPLAEIRELIEPILVEEADVAPEQQDQVAQNVQIDSGAGSAESTPADEPEEKVSAQVVPLPTAPHTGGGAQ